MIILSLGGRREGRREAAGGRSVLGTGRFLEAGQLVAVGWVPTVAAGGGGSRTWRDMERLHRPGESGRMGP